MNRHTFLSEWFSDCEGKIELRAIPTKQAHDRLFFKIDDFVGIKNFCQKKADKDLYFGLSTRNGQGGTKADIVNIPGTWADIDFKNILRKDVDKLLKECPLQPTFVVLSGGGYHAYWKFREPTDNLEIVELINRQLAQYFGSDPVHDATRILRLPDTFNHKYDPKRPVKILIHNENRQYNQGDFEEHLPPLKTDAANGGQSSNPPGWQEEIIEGVPNGKRNKDAAKLAGRYFEKGLSKAEVLTFLEGWNRKNSPPMTENELKAVVESISKTDNRNHPEGHSQDVKERGAMGMGFNELENEFSDKIEWLWRAHIPKALPSMVNGKEGDGKTTLCLQIAKEILDNHREGIVVWLATEGFVFDTVVKMRDMGLTTYGNRFLILKKPEGNYRFNLALTSDCTSIEKFLDTLDEPLLMVVTDSLRGASMYDVNEDKIKIPIQNLNTIVCDKYKAACLWIHHFKKGQERDLRDKSTGSPVIQASVRQTLSVLKKSGYIRLIKQAKSNISNSSELEMVMVENKIIIRECAEESEDSQGNRAEKFLIELFKDTDRVRATEGYEQAEKQGISKDMVSKMRKKLSIESKQDGFGGTWSWHWKLHGK